MAEQKTYPKGLYYNKPRENQPEWVNGSLTVYKERFIEWLATQPDDKIKIDLLTNKEGEGYSVVNDWKPQKESNGANLNHEPPLSFEDMRDELPF